MKLLDTIIFCFFWLQIFSVVANQYTGIELAEMSTSSNPPTSQASEEVSTTSVGSDSRVTMNNKKISYFHNQKVIDANIDKFNEIMNLGTDYLRDLPTDAIFSENKKLHYLLLISCYTTIGLFSLVMGFFYSVPISTFAVIIDYTDKLSSENTVVDFNYLIRLLGYSKNYYDPSYYKIKPEYYFSLLSMTAVFSATAYNVISKSTNLLKIYKYREKTIKHSQLIEFIKLGLIVAISVMAVDGYSNALKKNINLLYNIQDNQLINKEHEDIYNLFLFLAGFSSIIINSAYILPLFNLIVDTLHHGFKCIFSRPISCNNEKIPKILRNFIEYPQIANIKKRFILDLLQDNFDAEYNIKKSLQLMNLNLYEIINVAGIINNIKSIQSKKDKYNIEEVTHIRGFCEGVFKLSLTALLAAANFNIVYQLLSVYMMSRLILSSDYIIDTNTGYIIRSDGVFIPYKDDQPFLDSSLSPIDKNTVNLTDHDLIGRINNIELPVEHALTIAILISSGVSNMLVDSGYNLYKIIKTKGKLYRGPIPIVASAFALLSISAFSYNIISFLLTGKQAYAAGAKMLEYQNIDNSGILGISDPDTVFILGSFAGFFIFMQSYKIFLPITEAISLGVYKLYTRLFR